MNISALKTKGQATVTDISIGKRLKFRRSLAGLSQTKLADLLDISFQQVQKYETGKNRISASRLYEISKILDVSLEYFYLECSAGSDNSASQNSTEIRAYLDEEEGIRLLKAYYSIKDSSIRNSIINFIKELGK